MAELNRGNLNSWNFHLYYTYKKYSEASILQISIKIMSSIKKYLRKDALFR